MTSPARPRILVVEDEPELSSFLERLLAGAGYEVLLAATAAQAEAAAAGRRPDLLLVDIVLPDGNGWELGPRLAGGAPFVMMTGADVSDETRRDAELLGARAVIGKPFDAAQLLALLQSHLAGPSF